MSSLYGGGIVRPVIGVAAGCDCVCQGFPNLTLNSSANIMQCLALHNQTLAQNATLMQQAMNNPDLIRSIMDCTVQTVMLAAQDPTGWHIAAALPVFAGGFMLTNTGVRAMRLWLREAYWVLFKKK